MSIEELIQQFQMSSRLMKRAIACDDSDAVTRHDAVLSTTFERIVAFKVSNLTERLALGRFLAGYLIQIVQPPSITWTWPVVFVAPAT